MEIKNITNRYATKKSGKTEVYPFWYMKDIKNMIDYFKDNQLWDEYLTFMFQFLFGRRIGDILDMIWSDIFYENGNIKEEIRSIEEQKTGKTNVIYISPYAKEVINDYLKKTNKNPFDALDTYIFDFELKNEWKANKDNFIYKETDSIYSDDNAIKLIDKYCLEFNKDFADKRKMQILEGWKKKKEEYPTIGQYIYHEVDFKDIIKWQTDNYRKKFKMAANKNGIENVSTHSVRKSFGFWSKKIHPHDMMSLETLQDIFGHSDTQITMRYIGLSAERKKMYYNDIGEFLSNVSKGDYDIKKNSPIITLKEQDLRKIIMETIENKAGLNDAMLLNKVLDIVSELKLE